MGESQKVHFLKHIIWNNKPQKMEDESLKASRKEKRLKILADDEIESIYSRPNFTYEE